MKYYLGIDCGKDGAFAVLDENSKVIKMFNMPLIGKEYDTKKIKEILTKHKYVRIGIEKPPIIFGVSKSSIVSLIGCFKLIEGIIIGLGLPYVSINPKEWQKECWKHISVQKKTDGKNDTKATSLLAAQNIWNDVDFYVTQKGNKSINAHDGLVDACLVAEYIRRLF